MIYISCMIITVLNLKKSVTATNNKPFSNRYPGHQTTTHSECKIIHTEKHQQNHPSFLQPDGMPCIAEKFETA